MEQYKEEFIEFMVESNVLKFGDFTLQSMIITEMILMCCLARLTREFH